MIITKTKTVAVIVFTLSVLGLGVWAYWAFNNDPSNSQNNQSSTPFQPIGRQINYQADIQPILDRNCVACHSCYDAPCQLKLSSAEGVLRGATQRPVYNAKRTEQARPTRLGIDAQTQEEWRELGFHSVLKSVQIDDQFQHSLFRTFIEKGYHRPGDITEKITSRDIDLGKDRNAQCAKPAEARIHVDKHPYDGMPLAVQGLTETEYQTIMTWLEQGAKIEPAEWIISDADQKMIKKWEEWLNQDNPESQLLSRYIFEHLFLGHLYLSADSEMAESIRDNSRENQVQFYTLVRSSTPPQEPINPLSTTLPNSDPGTAFYYRLQPIKETLVYKTHIPYRFDAKRFDELKSHFYQEKWQVDTLPTYDYQARSNPFKTFAAIPAKLRYTFLLQDAEYFIRNFIRGPVCHGPIATDVIRDQFWVMFENPETEIFVGDQSYQKSVIDLIGLPGEDDKITEFNDQWQHYKDARNQYADRRQKAYQTAYPKGRPLSTLWQPEHNSNAFLTVFRHHDSASVLSGWIGEIPRTAWVLDYPLFERTYYELVVGFNVFGNISHQLQTRLYFDLIRHGGESNFLSFIPPKERKTLYDDWYQGFASLKTDMTYFNVDMQHLGTPDLQTESGQAKTSLFDTLMLKNPETTKAFDPINRKAEAYLSEDQNEPQSKQNPTDQLLRRITSQPASELPFIEALPDLTLLFVKQPEGAKPLVYSVIRNRMHSNVAFMLGEDLRYQPEQDSLSITPGLAGSYPNLILHTDAANLESMITTIKKVDSDDAFLKHMQPYILHRMDSDFWDILHQIANTYKETNPLQAGYLDINRYGYW